MEIHPKKKRHFSTKVDLTAMVDLGFLLITFFMLATSFAKPKAMDLFKPPDGAKFDYPQSKTATIIIGERDKAYCYSLPDKLESISDVKFDSVSYYAQGLRKYIIQKQVFVKTKYGNADQLFIIIKPMEESSLEHLVDVLDEIMITDVKHYAIVNEKTEVDSIIMNELKVKSKK